MTIWKFPLTVTDEQVIDIPAGAKLLSVQTQLGIPCLWALVEPTNRKEKRRFFMNGTGHEVDHACPFIGTFQINGGILVFHLFDGGIA